LFPKLGMGGTGWRSNLPALRRSPRKLAIKEVWELQNFLSLQVVNLCPCEKYKEGEIYKWNEASKSKGFKSSYPLTQRDPQEKGRLFSGTGGFTTLFFKRHNLRRGLFYRAPSITGEERLPHIRGFQQGFSPSIYNPHMCVGGNTKKGLLQLMGDNNHHGWC